MIDIQLSKVSKRYTSQWIIRNFDLHIPHSSRIGISGINGSGKSTLMRMMAGALSPSVGEIIYTSNGEKVIKDDWYCHVSLVGPYTDVIQEMNLEELYGFHTVFKTLRYDLKTFKDLLQLNNINNKRIEDYSSGMKQKLQLALAIFSKTPILIFDEPTSYLDEANKSWYYKMLTDHLDKRTLIIASNESSDFQHCDRVLDI